ncbi:hypothetical protein M426DRAFT_248900 [Hypoxylon sp. CI-4A]|nr:hypothetical protein M426DRAFT_248900 [Hypoxylon sp. CI-4A]
MNIEQLNASGQSLWVFVVTTIVIFALTMTVWGFMYQLHKYNSLPKVLRGGGGRYGSISFKDGLTHLWLLIRHGHLIWTWKSGIAFSLLTGGRKGFLRSCVNHVERGAKESNHSHHDLHDPCSYVKVHLNRGEWI